MLRLFSGGNGRLVHEAPGVFTKRLIEGDLAGGVNGVGLTVVDLVRRHQADPGMVMILVVPVKEASTESFSVLDTAKAFGEPGLILQCLEVAFGERIVVGSVRAVMRSGHAERPSGRSGVIAPSIRTIGLSLVGWSASGSSAWLIWRRRTKNSPADWSNDRAFSAKKSAIAFSPSAPTSPRSGTRRRRRRAIKRSSYMRSSRK